MGPALLMSETRACLRTLALSHCDVGEILTRANRVLAVDTHDFHFVTLALVRLDPRDRSHRLWQRRAAELPAACGRPA